MFWVRAMEVTGPFTIGVFFEEVEVLTVGQEGPAHCHHARCLSNICEWRLHGYKWLHVYRHICTVNYLNFIILWTAWAVLCNIKYTSNSNNEVNKEVVPLKKQKKTLTCSATVSGYVSYNIMRDCLLSPSNWAAPFYSTFISSYFLQISVYLLVKCCCWLMHQ